MKILSDWGAALSAAFAQFAERAGHFLPSILGAILLLLIGWVVARILRTVAIRTAFIVDRMMSRFIATASAERAKLSQSSAKILGSIVFWLVLLFFITAATQMLGLNAFTAWLAGVVNYVPTLFAGALIIAAGFLLSRLARELVVATSAIAGPRQRELLGRTVQAIILVTALLVGIEGRILELTPVSMILETEEGRVTLPAKVFGEEPIVLKIGER